jgi:hypothetical protein
VTNYISPEKVPYCLVPAYAVVVHKNNAVFCFSLSGFKKSPVFVGWKEVWVEKV